MFMLIYDKLPEGKTEEDLMDQIKSLDDRIKLQKNTGATIVFRSDKYTQSEWVSKLNAQFGLPFLFQLIKFDRKHRMYGGMGVQTV